MTKVLEAKEFWRGEKAEFFRMLAGRRAEYLDDFKLQEVRVVERKVASGHKVSYRIRGVFRT
jgi:hypothetical protein